MSQADSELCVFCEIIAGRLSASIVAENDSVVAFVDLRQFHPGHMLVVPRAHISDIRFANDETAAALMQMVARVARAVDRTFPNDGMSVWHSIGEGANQEVPHLHFHIHPRLMGDDMLRIYPHSPATPERRTLQVWGEQVAQALATDAISDKS